jgi:hypothetical protein
MARNPQVDAWFEALDRPVKAEMHRVRDIILAADSRITESIKWKTPTFSYEGNLASFNPAKRFVSLLFHEGASIPGAHPHLEGEGAHARTMRFANMSEVEERAGALQAVVRAWCDMRAASKSQSTNAARRR